MTRKEIKAEKKRITIVNLKDLFHKTFKSLNSKKALDDYVDSRVNYFFDEYVDDMVESFKATLKHTYPELTNQKIEGIFEEEMRTYNKRKVQRQIKFSDKNNKLILEHILHRESYISRMRKAASGLMLMNRVKKNNEGGVTNLGENQIKNLLNDVRDKKEGEENAKKEAAENAKNLEAAEPLESAGDGGKQSTGDMKDGSTGKNSKKLEKDVDIDTPFD